MHNRQQPFLRGHQLMWIELINRNIVKILGHVPSSPPFCWLPVELFLHQSACGPIFMLRKQVCKLFSAQFQYLQQNKLNVCVKNTYLCWRCCISSYEWELPCVRKKLKRTGDFQWADCGGCWGDALHCQTWSEKRPLFFDLLRGDHHIFQTPAHCKALSVFIFWLLHRRTSLCCSLQGP